MSIVGGYLESKKLGLIIDNNGTFYNTEYDAALNIIKLKKRPNGSYYKDGYWISDAIDLKDKFHDFEKVFTNNVTHGSSSVSISTRVSDDNLNWDNWISTGINGEILSDTKQYIQIKIDFTAGTSIKASLISDFNAKEEADLFTPSGFIDTTNGLSLKRDFKYDMTKDANWNSEGTLHKKLISKRNFKNINKISVVKK